MKADKRVVTVATTTGNTTTVDAQVFGPLALYRFSKAFSLRPGPLDFSVAYVPDGVLVGVFKKASTAKAFIEHLLAYEAPALASEAALVAAGRRIQTIWHDFYRRDFKSYPVPEEKR